MTIQRQKQNNSALWLVLGGAFVLRMILAGVTEGYPYDMSCFVAWGEKLLADGPAGFYSGGYFADYPPGYLFVLGLVALVRQIFSIPYEAGMTYVLLAVVPSLCDCAAAALVWHIGREKLPESRLPLLLAAFVAFDPLLLFDTAVWKQIDGAFALPLLLCFYLLEKRRYLPAAVLYGVALAIKPQALLFGPVLAVCFLVAIVQEENRFRAFLRCFGGAALALFPPLALGLPYFGLTNLLPKLLEKYAGTAASYPYATINGFNWLAAGQAGLCPGVPHRIFGRCSVLCGDAAVHLHCILPAVLAARPQFWSGRLVAVPGLDVQLPLHAGGDPPV